MAEPTHIYLGPCSCGCTVAGKRWMVRPGDRVPFGAESLDARAAKRLGEFFISLDEYDEDAPVGEASAPPTGPVWAHLTVAELAEQAQGFEAFSKAGLEALCRVGGLSPMGTTAQLRDRLAGDLEASLGDEEDEPATLDDIEKMDPEFGLPPEED
jgi:hypothetical protein